MSNGPKVVKSSQKAGPIPRTSTWYEKGIAGYRARKDTEAAEAKDMATLIAQLAQVGMIKPTSKVGENTLSAYGKHFEVITKEEDRAGIRQQQIIDAERKAIGELPLSDYEMAYQARGEALSYFKTPEWETREFAIKDALEGQPVAQQRAIAEAKADVIQESYNSLVSLQKQYHPDHYEKNPPPPDVPDIDPVTGEFSDEQSDKKKKQWPNLGESFMKMFTAPDEGVKPTGKVDTGGGFDLSMLNPLAAKEAYAGEGTPTKGKKRTFKGDWDAIPPWMKYGAGSIGAAGLLGAGGQAVQDIAAYRAGLISPRVMAAMQKMGNMRMAMPRMGQMLGGIKNIPALAGRGIAAGTGGALATGAVLGSAAAGYGAGRAIGRGQMPGGPPGMTVDARLQDTLLNDPNWMQKMLYHKTGFLKTQAEPMNPYYNQGQ